MQLGMVGLGRMGGNMARRLMRDSHQCVVYDLSPANIEDLVNEGATGVPALAGFTAALTRPRAVWIMVPAGAATESTVTALADVLEAGDAVIDGGNSFYKDDVRRAALLAERGIDYVDVGTSGGIWGAERGYCLMIGGVLEAVRRLEPIFRSLAPGGSNIAPTAERATAAATGESKVALQASAEHGYLHCGPIGAGHFVKMIHNGIEYGLMQAYAEGFDILRNAGNAERPDALRYDLNLADIAELWRRGSVVGSWLLDLIAMALAENPGLTSYSGFVQDSGEGRWTVQTAVEEAVPADVLSAALYARFRSRQEHTFAEKLLSAMRFKFGGHLERPK